MADSLKTTGKESQVELEQQLYDALAPPAAEQYTDSNKSRRNSLYVHPNTDGPFSRRGSKLPEFENIANDFTVCRDTCVMRVSSPRRVTHMH